MDTIHTSPPRISLTSLSPSEAVQKSRIESFKEILSSLSNSPHQLTLPHSPLRTPKPILTHFAECSPNFQWVTCLMPKSELVRIFAKESEDKTRFDAFNSQHVKAEEDEKIDKIERLSITKEQKLAPPPKRMRHVKKPLLGRMPREKLDILQKWFEDHKEDPYPTTDQKKLLSDATGLDMQQIQNWFVNIRSRMWKKTQPEDHFFDKLTWKIQMNRRTSNKLNH